MNKLIVLLFILCFAPTADAQSPELLTKILYQLNLRIEDCYKDLIVEKKLPDSPHESIVVIPKIVYLEEESFALDSYILIVNNQNGNIKNKYFEKSSTNGWESDAMRLGSISIDTAPYFVKDKVRAFGIRLNFSNTSRPNPYSYEWLSLFTIEGNKLVQVLKNFEVDRFSGESDADCAGKFEDVHKVLVIGASKTNAYFDIQVKAKISDITTKRLPNGDCDEKSATRKEESVLKFSNGKYK